MASPGTNEEIRRLRQELLRAQQGQAEADRLREEEKRLREEENRLAQAELALTDLPAFLDACHLHISMGLRIPTNPVFSTRGDPANADKKIRPDRICIWKEFPMQQAAIWNDLMESDFATEQYFTNMNQIKGTGVSVCRRSIDSEIDLNFFERITVEEPYR